MNRAYSIPRIPILIAAVFLVSAAIIMRLFFLQILSHAEYEEIARAEQYGYTTLPARRGEILIEDYHSGEMYKLGTNTTLKMIFADPTLIANPDLVATTLAPLLFDLDVEKDLDEARYEEEYEAIMLLENEAIRNEALKRLSYKTDEELAMDFERRLKDTLAKQTRDVILIAEELDTETQAKVRQANLTGTELSETGNLFAYPAKIGNKSSLAKQLADIFNTDADQLERILLGKNRFVILKRRLDPDISNQIDEILLADRQTEDPQYLGIRMQEEFFRFYPEQELGAQILGYVNSAGVGQYGVEGSYDEYLRGRDGVFTSQIDAFGNQITVGDSVIEQAQDGADIILTIDRAIQLQVERLLASGVREYQSDSGQAIVIDPKTGNILANAQYPSFNPNRYGDVFELTDIRFTDDEKERIFNVGTEEEPKLYFYKQIDPDVRYEIFPNEEDPEEYFKYVNEVGPEVYKNKSIQEAYEPGSVFKPIVMASAIDAGEVTANSTFVDDGPIPVDFNVISGEYEFEINTFDNNYYGVMTMTQVLEKSSNTGMTYIVRKLGPALFYNYLKRFGFLERTEMGLLDEVKGRLSHYKTWTAESEMITKAFGQGISMTPYQLIQAYTALANEGMMIRPRLVKRIEYPDGRVEEIEPEVIRRVLKKDTTEMIRAMMAATAESYAGLAIPNHYFAAKSGTAQTYKYGKALSGPGTTIASFVGFGPIDDPQFIVLVKMDHPRTIEWGARTAGPVASNILSFLYDYYNLPPDKE